MAKALFCATLLWGLLGVSCPAHAQTVALVVCNGGQVSVDVFASRSGQMSRAPVASGDCVLVAKTKGSMQPAYLGFGFADSHGRWGGSRRLDLLPDLGEGVLTRAAENVSVRHGSRNVPVQLQLLFRPRSPACHSERSTTAEERLPYNATATQQAIAASQDASQPPAGTTCDVLAYTLNVVAYSDSREVTFNYLCELCEKKAEAKMTPAERAARQQRANAVNQELRSLASMGPGAGMLIGSIYNTADAQNQEEAKHRKDDEVKMGPPKQMDFPKLIDFLASQGQRPLPIPNNVVTRATVSRVELPRPGAQEQWVNIYFKESPNRAFDVCLSRPGILRDLFGANFGAAMLGKPLEIQGELQRAYCDGNLASIRVTLMRQLRVVRSIRFPSAPIGPGLQPVAPPKPIPTEVYDRSMPNYSVTSEVAHSDIFQYCSGLYDPSFALLTPQQDRFRYAHAAETESETKECVSQFDPHEVAIHRRKAMYYCLGKYNYFLSGQANQMGAYRACMSRNDTLTAFCSLELRYRSELEHETDWASATCSTMPNNREAWVIEHKSPNDMRPLGAIPPEGPGLPPVIVSPMKPGVLQRSGEVPAIPKLTLASIAPTQAAPTPAAAQPAVPSAQSAAAARKAAARAAMRMPPPPAVVSRPRPAQTQESRAQRAAEQRKVGQELLACDQQALKDHPERGPALAKAVAACGQMMRATAPAAAPPQPASVARAGLVQPQESRAQRIAEQRKLDQKLLACDRQALQDHPERGPALAKAIAACGQMMRAKETR